MINRQLTALFSVAAAAFTITALALAQTPVISNNGVLNGASFAVGQPVAPGSLVSIFGTELASSLALNDTVPLSTSLSSVSVTFNGVPAGLYFVSGSQINVQVPWDILPAGASQGTASLVITRGTVTSEPQPVSMVSAAPGIFASGAWAIAINADGSLAASDGAIPGIATHPAAGGDALIILATGLGAVNPPVADGASSVDQLRTTLITPTVLVAGKSAQVLFSGLAPQFPGVNQVNIVVPGGIAAGVVPLQMQIGSILTTNQVTIAVR